MRCLTRNKSIFYISQYLGKEKSYTEDGYFKGQNITKYGSIKKMYGNISPCSGEMSIAVFGGDEQYDKIIILPKNNRVKINEYSRLWIGIPPYDANGNETANNYVVRKIAESLNSITVAVAKVLVNV